MAPSTWRCSVTIIVHRRDGGLLVGVLFTRCSALKLGARVRGTWHRTCRVPQGEIRPSQVARRSAESPGQVLIVWNRCATVGLPPGQGLLGDGGCGPGNSPLRLGGDGVRVMARRQRAEALPD